MAELPTLQCGVLGAPQDTTTPPHPRHMLMLQRVGRLHGAHLDRKNGLQKVKGALPQMTCSSELGNSVQRPIKPAWPQSRGRCYRVLYRVQLPTHFMRFCFSSLHPLPYYFSFFGSPAHSHRYTSATGVGCARRQYLLFEEVSLFQSQSVRLGDDRNDVDHFTEAPHELHIQGPQAGRERRNSVRNAAEKTGLNPGASPWKTVPACAKLVRTERAQSISSILFTARTQD